MNSQSNAASRPTDPHLLPHTVPLDNHTSANAVFIRTCSGGAGMFFFDLNPPMSPRRGKSISPGSSAAKHPHVAARSATLMCLNRAESVFNYKIHLDTVFISFKGEQRCCYFNQRVHSRELVRCDTMSIWACWWTGWPRWVFCPPTLSADKKKDEKMFCRAEERVVQPFPIR